MLKILLNEVKITNWQHSQLLLVAAYLKSIGWRSWSMAISESISEEINITYSAIMQNSPNTPKSEKLEWINEFDGSVFTLQNYLLRSLAISNLDFTQLTYLARQVLPSCESLHIFIDSAEADLQIFCELLIQTSPTILALSLLDWAHSDDLHRWLINCDCIPNQVARLSLGDIGKNCERLGVFFAKELPKFKTFCAHKWTLCNWSAKTVAMLSSNSLNRLDNLVLDNVKILDCGFSQSSNNSILQSIRSIYLNRCTMSANACIALSDFIHQLSLESIVLKDCNLSETSMDNIIANLQVLPCYIDLSGNSVSKYSLFNLIDKILETSNSHVNLFIPNYMQECVDIKKNALITIHYC
jgi:hypothetical protein